MVNDLVPVPPMTSPPAGDSRIVQALGKDKHLVATLLPVQVYNILWLSQATFTHTQPPAGTAAGKLVYIVISFAPAATLSSGEIVYYRPLSFWLCV